MRVIWYICRQIATHRLNWKKKVSCLYRHLFLALTWRKMEDELHPRSELYYRQQARPIPPIPDLGVADMEAFVVAAGFQLPGHLGRDYNAALRNDFNIAYRKIARQELTTPNSRTDSVALAKGALRLIKQGLSFRGQPEAENKFYRCEVGDQYTKESMKEWVEKCVAREMRQDKAHIQTFETAQQLVLCVMSVSALHALFPHVDRSFFVGWKRFRESERPQFSCTLAPFPYGRRKKESERLEWVGEGEERKQVRKVVYGVEDVGSPVLILRVSLRVCVKQCVPDTKHKIKIPTHIPHQQQPFALVFFEETRQLETKKGGVKKVRVGGPGVRVGRLVDDRKIEFWVTSDGMCNVAGVFKQCFMDSDSELFVWGRVQGGELEECVGDYKKEDIIITFSQAHTISRRGGGGGLSYIRRL
eukprot:g22288.t1